MWIRKGNNDITVNSQPKLFLYSAQGLTPSVNDSIAQISKLYFTGFMIHRIFSFNALVYFRIFLQYMYFMYHSQWCSNHNKLIQILHKTQTCYYVCVCVCIVYRITLQVLYGYSRKHTHII